MAAASATRADDHKILQSDILFKKFRQMKKLIALLVIALTISPSVFAQRRGADYLVYELSFITRFIDLTPEQQSKWNLAVSTTKAMPDVTKGTYKAMKESIKKSIDQPNFDFLKAYLDLINGLYSVRNKTVEEHKKVAVSWALFDASLNEDQRAVFRSKISPTLVDFFNRMSDGNEKSLRFPELSSDNFARQLGYTNEQIRAADFYAAEIQKISSQSKLNREKYLAQIQGVIANPGIDFSVIYQAMESGYNEHRGLITSGADALADFSQSLTIDQKTKLNEIMLGKLKFMERFIPNR
jgi:hypothetical protein